MKREILFRSAEDFVPQEINQIATLAKASLRCQGCDLFKKATQTVFGEGNEKAAICLVGEQPGNEEDLKGHPFVGPAGKVLNEILLKVEIDRKKVYVTNAVKHFSWKPLGKRRLHQKPRDGEIAACRPWLVHELEIVKPKLIICMGATAARSVFNRAMKIEAERRKVYASPLCRVTIITYHPSAALRAYDEVSRSVIRQKIEEDFLFAKSLLAGDQMIESQSAKSS